MNVAIKVIDHTIQKYETVGNWGFDTDGNVWIEVSRLSDWRREMLIAVHELIEVLTCKHNGVGQEAVDKFDLEFERRRQDGNEDEPGDEPTAPYVDEHCLATGIERILAQQWGVKWKDYGDELSALPPVTEKQ